jgi:hypothetical protein
VRWKYHLPHTWNSPEDRTVWEDVYLMPEDGSMKGKSIWFTLDTLTVGAAGLKMIFRTRPKKYANSTCVFSKTKITSSPLLLT